MEDATVYGDDPSAMARRWVEEGAEALHIVDLDGAMEGQPTNVEEVLGIRESVSVPLQVGGGIRSGKAVSVYLDRGIDTVIVGTRAALDAEFLGSLCAAYPGRVAVGIDARDGRVAIKGWTEVTETEATELALRVQDLGASKIIYTDIALDGMLAGPNVEATRELARRGGVPVVASGGISTLEDVRRLKKLKPEGVEGLIVGKALYEKTLFLAEALEVLAES
jgi:phosphoribosylformimino-5-aminoimidazole carboxamide ribotide isomerase